ncbi:MAG TPA: PIN domain-containing protein [Desulfobacterales bacterium]|nr:PIN domain-containing protein [Desulfobacterales bacterium]
MSSIIRAAPPAAPGGRHFPCRIIDLWKTDKVLFSAQTPKLNVVLEDPDDNKFIECAVALKARFLVSGDKHLTGIKDYMKIKIVSPKEFLDLM